MNYDEFAYFNQQLAGMLRSGIPLEGALKQLCATMQRGTLRTEVEALNADLARGRPLRDAIASRRLPDLYVRLVQAGARGQDLPGLLTLLADYYQRRQSLWLKLKALMVYPLIVLGAALVVSTLISRFYGIYAASAMEMFEGCAWPGAATAGGQGLIWLPTIWLALLLGACLLAWLLPAWREWARWRLPGFKESSLSQFAATMKLLLAAGGDAADAVRLMSAVERDTRVGPELRRWQERLAAGSGRFAEFSAGSRVFPPLFLWLIGQSGEDLVTGFARAAEIYYERARHRVEMLLYAALPAAVLVLGVMVFGQIFFVIRIMGGIAGMLDALGGVE